jgi:hypothetical protein
VVTGRAELGQYAKLPAAAGVAWHICIALLSVLLRRIFERQFYPGAYRLAPPGSGKRHDREQQEPLICS